MDKEKVLAYALAIPRDPLRHSAQTYAFFRERGCNGRATYSIMLSNVKTHMDTILKFFEPVGW